jgi:hypothetical protein
MTVLFAVGGEQRPALRAQPEWTSFKTAVVARVDLTAGGRRVERVLEHTSPPEHRPDERPSHVFKAATIAGGTAYLCTQTEVLVCDFPSFAVRRVISHPCFNDLHHVAPAPDGSLYVAVTGLDAVAHLAPDGRLLSLTGVLGADPWERFSPDVDYRKVPTTKPHQAHPNYVFFPDGDARPWVTRFAQRDAVPVAGDGPRFAVEVQGVHDGHVTAGEVLFTTVDGHLVRFDRQGGSRRVIDLNPAPGDADEGVPLGWCRGLLPWGGERAWVGFTRLRRTSLQRNLSWLRHGFRRTPYHRMRPTRLALYDLGAAASSGSDGSGGRARLLDEVDLEAAGMSAVFSIHLGIDGTGGVEAMEAARELHRRGP